MSFDSLLTHTVHLERDVDTGSDDGYEVATTTVAVGQSFKAAIQPRTAREIAAATQAGAPLSDFTIFMRARVLTTGDRIVHDTADCALADVADYQDAWFEITGIRNAAGLGHHLEVDARLVGATGSVEGS